MTFVRPVVVLAAVVAMAAWFSARDVAARQTAPGAPSGLSYLVSPGGGVSLQWTHATGTFTHYVIEAGATPGTTFFRHLTSTSADGLLYGKSPELLPTFGVGGVGAGDYYVRVRGANGAVEGPPSNEVLVPVRAGCSLPGAPTNFTQIVRGTNGYLMWNPGDGGQPTVYTVRASFVPNDPAPPIQLPLNTLYLTLGIPPGTYYAHVIATNACGTSARSNELVISSPNQTDARTANPGPGGRLPQPFVRDLVLQLANEAKAQGLMNPSVACPTRSAGPYRDAAHELEARKTQLNPFVNYIVDRLRQIDQRFGYNAKPTRSWVPSIVAGDEIAYHYGADAPEGSPNAYAVDVLGGHCTGVGVVDNNNVDRHEREYRPFYTEFVRWTGAGRF